MRMRGLTNAHAPPARGTVNVSVVLAKCHFVSASQFSYWHSLRCFSPDVCHGRTPSPRPRQGQEGDHGRPLQAPGPLFLRPPRAGGSALPLSPPPLHLDPPPGTNTLHRRRSVSGAVPERPLLPLGRGSPAAADLTLGVGPAADAAGPTRGPLRPRLSLRRPAADAACPTRGSLGPSLSLQRRWPCRHAVRRPAAGAGAISRRPLGFREPRRPVSRRPARSAAGASGPPARPLGPRRSCGSPPAAAGVGQSVHTSGAPALRTSHRHHMASRSCYSTALTSHSTSHCHRTESCTTGSCSGTLPPPCSTYPPAASLSPECRAPLVPLPPARRLPGLPHCRPRPRGSPPIRPQRPRWALFSHCRPSCHNHLSHLLLHSSPPSSWLLSTPLSLPSPVSLLQPLPEVSS